MRRSFAAITALACLVAPASVLAENAYITNLVSANVSVIDTATNTVIATIPVGIGQNGVAVTPDGSKVYVTNVNVPFVSVIDTGTNTVIATIFVGGLSPFGVAVTPDGSNVYVTDSSRLGHVSVIDTGTNTVIATIPVGEGPRGVAVTPDGSKVYVTNVQLPNPSVVSVIATATNTVIATIPLGGVSNGVAVTPDGRKVYVANSGSNNVFVIDTATNAVIGSPIPVGLFPFGVAVTPDGDRHAGKDEKEAQHGEAERDRHRRAGEHEGGKVYVANRDNDNVSVIDTATNTVIATIPVGSFPLGVAVTPDGRKVYVANSGSNNVFVIDTASNLVLAVVSVGIQPVAFGAFIRQPAPFAGTPREPGCHGKSVSALAEQFGGLPAAATARGFSSVPALQDAINVFCRGGAAAAD